MARSLIDILDDLAPSVQRAFLESVQDIKSRATLRRIERSLSAGDIDAALRALNITEEAFEPLRRALRDAYETGGGLVVEDLPEIKDGDGFAAVLRFNGANARAEAYLASASGGLITSIVAEQLDAVRSYLVEGMARGENPREVALDLIGRVDKAAGRRVGGIVGLAANQLQWMQNALDELASGDPAQLRNYLTRRTRDKRFDSVVRAAIRDGRRIGAAKARKMLARMQDRLLKARGDAIARTELLRSLHAAQYEALRQQVDAGLLDADQIRLAWDATGDGRTRVSHNLLDGQVRDFGQPFVTVNGFRMMHPGDTSLGAPGSETVNCRCWLRPDIDFLKGVS